MVKRFRFVLLLVTPLLASLTACQVFVELFSLSPFPGYLAQAVASVDLSTEIEKYLEELVAEGLIVRQSLPTERREKPLVVYFMRGCRR